MSNPDAAARQAFELCQEGGYLDQVIRAGRIPSARDIGHYIRVTGREPEFDTDEPVFVLQFFGEIRLPSGRGETWIDPICFVVGDRSGFMATGDVRGPDGSVSSPQPAPAPDRSLPQVMP